MILLRITAAVLFALLGLAGRTGLSPVAGQAHEGERQVHSLEAARARWQRLSPEERERAQARFRRFLAMSEEDREQLRESARRLRERSERVQEELKEKAGERLSQLEPDQRRTIVREIVAEQSRELGARIRARLPEKWLEELEKAQPEERARLLRQFQIRQRDRVARYAIGELGKRLSLPAEEIGKLQALPGEERGKAVLELRQRLSARDAKDHGLPPGITPERWEAWLALSPEAFFEAFEGYRQSRIEFAARERDLLDAARSRPEDALALADLSPEERAARLAAKKRARCLEVIRERELLPPAEILALEASGDRKFFEIVRRLLRDPGRNVEPGRR